MRIGTFLTIEFRGRLLFELVLCVYFEVICCGEPTSIGERDKVSKLRTVYFNIKKNRIKYHEITSSLLAFLSK